MALSSNVGKMSQWHLVYLPGGRKLVLSPAKWAKQRAPRKTSPSKDAAARELQVLAYGKPLGNPWEFSFLREWDQGFHSSSRSCDRYSLSLKINNLQEIHFPKSNTCRIHSGNIQNKAITMKFEKWLWNSVLHMKNGGLRHCILQLVHQSHQTQDCLTVKAVSFPSPTWKQNEPLAFCLEVLCIPARKYLQCQEKTKKREFGVVPKAITSLSWPITSSCLSISIGWTWLTGPTWSSYSKILTMITLGHLEKQNFRATSSTTCLIIFQLN